MGSRICSVFKNICVQKSHFISHLCAEITEEFQERLEKSANTDDLTKLVFEIVPYFLSHNAEPDACDLLIEIEQVTASF